MIEVNDLRWNLDVPAGPVLVAVSRIGCTKWHKNEQKVPPASPVKHGNGMAAADIVEIVGWWHLPVW
jgi:hypothetical protein